MRYVLITSKNKPEAYLGYLINNDAVNITIKNGYRLYNMDEGITLQTFCDYGVPYIALLLKLFDFEKIDLLYIGDPLKIYDVSERAKETIGSYIRCKQRESETKQKEKEMKEEVKIPTLDCFLNNLAKRVEKLESMAGRKSPDIEKDEMSSADVIVLKVNLMSGFKDKYGNDVFSVKLKDKYNNITEVNGHEFLKAILKKEIKNYSITVE